LSTDPHVEYEGRVAGPGHPDAPPLPSLVASAHTRFVTPGPDAVRPLAAPPPGALAAPTRAGATPFPLDAIDID
jgi:hypothetical protein